jgi:hypothetical protein
MIEIRRDQQNETKCTKRLVLNHTLIIVCRIYFISKFKKNDKILLGFIFLIHLVMFGQQI